MKETTHSQSRGRRPRPSKPAKPPEQFLAAGLTLAMLPPLPLAQRAPRRIVTRSGYRVRGANLAVASSPKLEWESPLEASAIVILGLCKSVERIFTQPLVLDIEGMRYTPDLLVFLRDGSRVWIECKPNGRIDQEMKHKLGLVNALLRGVGDRFVVLDESVLAEHSPVVDNCRYLSRWADFAASESTCAWQAAPYGELVDKHGADRVNAALAAGRYQFDMTKPLCRQTPVSPSSNGAAYELAFLYS
jgi:hypothetical protein